MDTTPLIFVVGLLAGFLSGAIGGGSGLLLVPVQILLGIDPKIATTTTHFGFIGVSLGSIARFKKEDKIKSKYIIPFVVIASLSGLIGPHLLFALDVKLFQRFIAFLILICVPVFIFKKNLGTVHSSESFGKQIVGYCLFFLILTLQVAFGAATGILAIFLLVYFFGLSMIQTSAILRFPNLVSSLIALAVYARHDQVNYEYGITLLIAMVVGGYFGSHVAIKGGEKFVKYSFAMLAIVLAIIILIK